MTEPDDARASGDALRHLDELLLGGPRRYTRAEVAERAGVHVDQARRLWRALGFSSVPDAEVAFTDGDVEALRCVADLTAQGVLDEDSAAYVARILGRSMARLARVDGSLVGGWLVGQVRSGALADPVVQGAQAAAQVLPQTEELMRHVWRRHVAAVVGGFVTDAAGTYAAQAIRAVAFVDLSGFTALSRRLTDEELLHLLDAFESDATSVVASYGGRVVKTAGDGILFVCNDLLSAARASLTLAEQGLRGGKLPARVGLSYGPVLRYAGDIYGETVNIAARLTAIAKPSTVFIDRGAADLLAAVPEFEVHSRRGKRVRGYRRLDGAELSRAGQAPALARSVHRRR